MKICPACGEVYSDQVGRCASDGHQLTHSSDHVPTKEWAVPLGSVVGGYRLVDRLGKGGMGVVYRAEHQRLGKKVAIKMLRPDLAGQQALVQRFFDEARAATRIGHDGIVQIFDFIEEGDKRCYVMELLEGHPLSAELDGKPMDPERVARIGAQIASALGAAHDAGVIHRDLKPDNVFLRKTADGGEQVKLLDFGIAKLKESEDAGASLTQTGVVLGTPAYMSPEQLEGMRLDARSDIYALGVLLYEMATGMRPFRGRTVAEIILKHVRERPVPPSQVVPAELALPGSLEQAILACLEKNREHRPQSMADVASLLEGAPSPTLEIPAASMPPARWWCAPRERTSPTGTSQPSLSALSSGELAAVRSPARTLLYVAAGVAVAVLVVGAGLWVLMARLREPNVVAVPVDEALTSPTPAPSPAPSPPAPPAPAAPAPIAPAPPAEPEPAAVPAPAAPEPVPAVASPPPRPAPTPAALKPAPKKPPRDKPAKKPKAPATQAPSDANKDKLVDPFG